ncbi:hypothetical protein M0811_11633 [Anaeramoeba ignava]|uniref:Uncharacterized protein n=1 Tax=Anaeramoeba ignava TaxID=1746090 RepID=A0A9Q0LBL3_ANAIG|nr:hypothetical protein M0811_11633 [Anaeramoeba ignava]
MQTTLYLMESNFYHGSFWIIQFFPNYHLNLNSDCFNQLNKNSERLKTILKIKKEKDVLINLSDNQETGDMLYYSCRKLKIDNPNSNIVVIHLAILKTLEKCFFIQFKEEVQKPFSVNIDSLIFPNPKSIFNIEQLSKI